MLEFIAANLETLQIIQVTNIPVELVTNLLLSAAAIKVLVK